MTYSRFLASSIAGLLFAAAAVSVRAEDDVPALSSVQAIVSVADQKIAVLRDGKVVAKYPISTSRFGVGDQAGSYKTPLGKLKVYDKIGDRLPEGAVLKHRRATGEVIAVNAPGRDPIVTRVLWLEGQESQNSRAKDRGIYIHGTAEERLIGKPASYGCIRMRSKDVVSLYEELSVGASVDIIPDKLPRLAKYEPPSARDQARAAAAIAKAKEEEAARVAKVQEEAARIAKAQEEAAKAEAARLAKVQEEEAKAEAAKVAKAQEASRVETARLARAEVAVAKAKPAPIAEAPSESLPAKPVAREASTTLRLAVARESDVKPATKPPATTKLVATVERPIEPTASVAKPAKPAVEKAPPAIASAPVARPVASAPSEPTRLASARRPAAAKPITVPIPIDPDRLAFIRSYESNLATAHVSEATDAPSADLSSRMKGSILDTGLSH